MSGGVVELVLAGDCDAEDAGLRVSCAAFGTAFFVAIVAKGSKEKDGAGAAKKGVKNVQDPRGKHEGDTNLLLPIHLHPPHQWQRHDDQREIRNDVTKAVDVGDIPGFGFAFRLWILEKLEIPGGFDGPACEDGQEYGDGCPDTEDPTDDPGGDPEPSVDVEDAVEEEEQRCFGEGDGDDVEVSVYGEHLVFCCCQRHVRLHSAE